MFAGFKNLKTHPEIKKKRPTPFPRKPRDRDKIKR
jgi:hypothetical protein